MLMAKTMQKQLDKAGIELTVQEFGFLNWLSLNDQMIQQDLAEFMKKDKSAVLRVIDSLENRQLVKRVNDPDDRRKKIVELTDLGEKLLGQAREVEQQVVSQLQEGLTEEEVATFIRVAFHMQQKALN